MYVHGHVAALAEQALKTEKLEAVIVSAKAAQEHAEQQLTQTQLELQGVHAELAGLKEEVDTEKVGSVHQIPFSKGFHFLVHDV